MSITARPIATTQPTVEERLDKLEDESAIRALVAAFADASSRNDMAELRSTWKHDGVFTVGTPHALVRHGVEELCALITEVLRGKEFFVQFAHSGVISVNGHRATARWLVEEVAKGGDQYYHNYGYFSDLIEKVDGKWLFAERAFHYVYLDISPFAGSTYALPNPVPSH